MCQPKDLEQQREMILETNNSKEEWHSQFLLCYLKLNSQWLVKIQVNVNTQMLLIHIWIQENYEINLNMILQEPMLLSNAQVSFWYQENIHIGCSLRLCLLFTSISFAIVIGIYLEVNKLYGRGLYIFFHLNKFLNML